MIDSKELLLEPMIADSLPRRAPKDRTHPPSILSTQDLELI
jgi:hypothetical protein